MTSVFMCGKDLRRSPQERDLRLLQAENEQAAGKHLAFEEVDSLPVLQWTGGDQCFVSIALRIFKITKSKDFDRSLTNLPRTGEQLPGDSGGKFPSNICRKQLELMDKKT